MFAVFISERWVMGYLFYFKKNLYFLLLFYNAQVKF